MPITSLVDPIVGKHGHYELEDNLRSLVLRLSVMVLLSHRVFPSILILRVGPVAEKEAVGNCKQIANVVFCGVSECG